MPKLNDYWDKYGCTQCNDYGCLSMVVNFSDSKSAFQGWMDQNNQTCPGVCKDEGGQDFIDAVNYNAGGPTYMIRPDKSWDRTTNYASESDITSEGIEEHICGTPITHELDKDKISNNISFLKVTKNGFSVDVLKGGVYSISFYSANGQLKTMVSEKFLSTGSHQLSFEKGKLASGVYFVEMRNGKNIARQKVILE